MNLQLTDKTALVCAASKGLGYACALSLAREGAAVTIVARHADTLEQAAQRIEAATGVRPATVAADITTPQGRAAALAACDAPDILVNNCGGPKPGDFRDWNEADWNEALNANMVTPIALIRAVIDDMIRRRFGRIVNITSFTVKMPIAHLGLSNGARAGLTGFVAGLARQVVQHNVTLNNLLPGPFETDRVVQVARQTAEQTGQDVETVLRHQRETIPAGRLGDPAELGDACAYLCAAQSGFMTGQNLVLDGGVYPGTL